MTDSPPNPSVAFPPSGAKWHSHTATNMLKARNLTREVLTKVRENEVAEAASKDAATEQANREKEGRKKQVLKSAAVHGEIISTSYRCMQRIEDAILQTEDGLSKLTHERYKGFAMLQVCERRQELRQKRPPAENFKDPLTEALENERKVLESLRKELFALYEEGRKIAADMQDMRSFLSHDTGERRLHMAHDFSALKATLAPHAESEEKAPEAVTHTQSQAKKAESDELIKKTLALLSRAEGHRLRSLDLCSKCRQEQGRANHHTEHCLSRRTVELAELKRQLERHAIDVDAAILTAERSLYRTEQRLDPRDKGKSQKLAGDKALLEQLRQSRTSLQEDIRNKFAALEIDNMCRRVTPAKASEAKRLVRTQSAPAARRKELHSSSSFSDLGTMTPMTGTDLESWESTSRPPSSAKLPAVASSPGVPGRSKSLKAGGTAAVNQ